MGSLVYIDRHVHIQACGRRAVHHLFYRIIKVCKLHQSVELIVCGQRRIAQHVSHVGSSQHIELAPHAEVVKWPVQQRKHVDESLAESLGAQFFLGINDLIILGTHLQVKHHP